MGETAQQPTATAAREALPKLASLATPGAARPDVEHEQPPADRGRPARRVHARRDAPMGEQVSERGAAGRWRVLLHHRARVDAAAGRARTRLPPHTITGEQFWGGALHPLAKTATPTGRQR